MKRKFNLSTLILLAALPLGVLAVEPPPPTGDVPAGKAPVTPGASPAQVKPAPLFEQLDTNHDGYLSNEEAKRSAEVTARFNELDGDHNGRIDIYEFNKGMQENLSVAA